MDRVSLPSVYDFLDVKEYLRSYREARKRVDQGFTHTYICYALGQKNSKGYFTNVVNGKVRIGPTIMERFILLLELDKWESAYFRTLVEYTQCAERGERERLFTSLISKNRKNCVEITEQAMPYYQHWHYAVIRALLDVVSFDGSDPSILAKYILLPITLKEVENAVQLLKDTGLIAKNGDGFYKPKDSVITPSKTIEQALLVQHQIMQFGHSQDVLAHNEIRPQKALSMTLSVSDNTYSKISERISELKSEIRSLALHDEEQAQRLYQINMHLFPHSRSL